MAKQGTLLVVDDNRNILTSLQYLLEDLKSASNLNDNLNCSKELEHYAS